MRFGRKSASDSDYYNKEVALNELLGAFISETVDVSSVNDSDSAQTLLAANPDRKGFSIFNDSTQILYVKLGAAATTTDFSFRITPQGYYESSTLCYTGIITGIWAANGSGAARLSEYE